MAQRSAAHVALGRAVRDLRAERGISQEELARRSELHRTYMGDVERGKRNLGYANLRKIAGALRVRPSELLMRAEALEEDDTDSAQN